MATTEENVPAPEAATNGPGSAGFSSSEVAAAAVAEAAARAAAAAASLQGGPSATSEEHGATPSAPPPVTPVSADLSAGGAPGAYNAVAPPASAPAAGAPAASGTGLGDFEAAKRKAEELAAKFSGGGSAPSAPSSTSCRLRGASRPRRPRPGVPAPGASAMEVRVPQDLVHLFSRFPFIRRALF